MAENENQEIKKVPAYGNLVVREIIEYPGEGVRIKWVNNACEDTLISSEGQEKPLFDFIKKRFPDPKKAADAGLAIDTDEYGIVIQIGEINGEPVKPLTRDPGEAK